MANRKTKVEGASSGQHSGKAVLPAVLFCRWKLMWSKPVNEDDITRHLCTEAGHILCGIDKKFIGVYEWGDGPVAPTKANKNCACRLCVAIAEKKHGW